MWTSCVSWTMAVIRDLRSHMKTEIVNPVRHNHLTGDSNMYTGFESVKIRSQF